jgi:hypothetical protein
MLGDSPGLINHCKKKGSDLIYQREKIQMLLSVDMGEDRCWMMPSILLSAIKWNWRQRKYLFQMPLGKVYNKIPSLRNRNPLTSDGIPKLLGNMFVQI